MMNFVLHFQQPRIQIFYLQSMDLDTSSTDFLQETSVFQSFHASRKSANNNISHFQNVIRPPDVHQLLNSPKINAILCILHSVTPKYYPRSENTPFSPICCKQRTVARRVKGWKRRRGTEIQLERFNDKSVDSLKQDSGAVLLVSGHVGSRANGLMKAEAKKGSRPTEYLVRYDSTLEILNMELKLDHNVGLCIPPHAGGSSPHFLFDTFCRVMQLP
ncbi:hypothetical protein DAPPUDRAFT_112758 [Daphnia pulex]|uniref:Uncharacterized protein n=1 Tax=Daphnia pulex TaxID=6669 RepID=E9HCZ6_DAPPU|nr:hypothetical protein DAPPUDRAFT_112758 [Daphnia pulex]|eukprot:EFX70386.1 hypothetical protein DAPPUDRAFT_112758 [Daphnia pulex]